MDLSVKIAHDFNSEWANWVMITMVNSGGFVISQTGANLRWTKDH
jgi:hypothetical protein